METVILYIAKTGICLGVFLIIYLLFLRRTTFFRFNRLFLLSGFIISLILPAIKYTYDVIIPASNIETLNTALNTSAALPANNMNIWNILFYLYITGIVLLSVRNLTTYRKLQRLISGGAKSSLGTYKLIENNEVQSPFTVLNYILLSSKNMNITEKDLILKHETTHIKQKHWIDLLCSECVLLLQWFNPFTWIYVHLLKENHEFLADKAVLDSGVSPVVYQAVLINQRFQGTVFSLSNSFNHSKPLNRLSMMNKSKTSSWKRLSALIVIPVFGIFIWASAVPKYVMEIPNDITNILETKDSTKVQVYVFEKKSSTQVDKDEKYVTKTTTTITKSKDAKNPLYIIDKEMKYEHELKDIKPEDIDNISVLKSESAVNAYGEKAKNGAVIINTKTFTNNNPTPHISIDTVLLRDKPVNAITVNSKTSHTSVRSTNLDDTSNVLIILDGKEVGNKTMKELDPNRIESINVLKDKSATDAYGDKGKNGVIIITSKK